MKAIIQLTTMSGHVVEKARWERNFVVPPTEGQSLQINVPTDDGSLISYSPKLLQHGVIMDGTKGEYTITFTCIMRHIKHMLDVQDSTVNCLILATPENRASDQVMTYLMDREKCEVAFLNAMKATR